MKKYDSDCKVITNGWSGMNSTQLRSYLSELVEVDDDVVYWWLVQIIESFLMKWRFCFMI